MTLLSSPLSAYGFTYDNFGAVPGASFGGSITPGASNAEGAWTQVASSGVLTADCYWLYFVVHTGATATAIKSHLLDIGVDPAGGTSYVAVVSNFVVGASPAIAAGNREYLIPFFVKSGSSVAVRIQGSNATAGTVRVAVKFYGKPSRPEAVPVGRYSETIGTITNSEGQSITPGNGVYSAYATLGTTVKPLWWWQIGYQVSNATITAERAYIELSWGDVTNKRVITRIMHAGTTNETCGVVVNPSMGVCEAYCPVPAGSTIYARMLCENLPDTGYNMVALGIGG
jgi:hypothetical protein